jgi:hypothetical protein
VSLSSPDKLQEHIMKRCLLLLLVMLGGCAIAPYDGYYGSPYGSPYDGYPGYDAYSGPAYVAPAPAYYGPSFYFGGGYRHGYRHGYRGGRGHHR